MTQKRTPLSLCGVSVEPIFAPRTSSRLLLLTFASPATFWWDSSMPSPVS